MAVRHEILNDELHISIVQQWPHCKAVGNRDISHTLVGEQDGPSPMEKGVGISGQNHIGVYPAIPLLGIY